MSFKEKVSRFILVFGFDNMQNFFFNFAALPENILVLTPFVTAT